MSEEDLPTLLRQEQETNLILQETIADLELAVEDRSWTRLTTEANSEFSHGGRQMITSLCRMVAIANPLVKRCIMLRISYIWGGGVALAARDDKVQEVIQEFWDDNTAVLSGSQAQEELERALATDGNVYLAGFTSALTGRVQVRSISQDEILDVITNPEDRDEPWFYIREYTRTSFGANGDDPTVTQTNTETVKEVFPALGYTPATRVKNINKAPVKWDAPMLHVCVNRLDGWRYGIPDVYASLPWARAYKDFLTDWALLTKSLAKFAWKVTGDTRSRANKAIAALQQSVTDSSPLNQPNTAGTAGQIAGSGPGLSLDAIPKAGAHIDADSGRPLAAMVATGFGVPVTMALADPGVTGARATARTLDKPTQLEMEMRRSLWQSQLGQLLDYVIDQAVIAPKGGLKGTVTVDGWGRRVVNLPGNTERTVDWNWPELAEIDPVQLITGITTAQPFIPAETTTRLLLNALDVDNVDELIDEMKDDNGDFVPPEQAAQAQAVAKFGQGGPPTPAVGQAAVNAARAGADPAAVVGSGPKARESVQEADRVYHWKHGWIPLDHTDAPEADSGVTREQFDGWLGAQEKALSLEQMKALKSYVGLGYERINPALRGKSTLSDYDKNQVAQLDAAFEKAASTNDKPITVFRAGGREGSDAAYVSTSWQWNEDLQKEFGAPITVHVPAGSKFLVFHRDRELLFPRGSHFRSNPDGSLVLSKGSS